MSYQDLTGSDGEDSHADLSNNASFLLSSYRSSSKRLTKSKSRQHDHTTAQSTDHNNYDQQALIQQEAFEKCWAHSRLRAASRPLTRCRYRYGHAPPAHRCPWRQRQRWQRQRVTEGTAMAPWNGPNKSAMALLRPDSSTAQTAQSRCIHLTVFICISIKT